MTLFEKCFNIIKTAINGTLPWIWQVFDSVGAWKYVVAIIFSMLIIRNLLYPFMKEAVGMGSDRADPEVEGRRTVYVHPSLSGTLPPSLRNQKKLKG